MKYLILIYGNPASRQVWDSFTEAERGEGWAAYAALDRELAASGELVASEALADPSQGRRLPALRGLPAPAEGRPETDGHHAHDGPFAEAKEFLAGFYLVDCDSPERATAIAARVPEAEYGLVEVRPVLTMTGMDM